MFSMLLTLRGHFNPLKLGFDTMVCSPQALPFRRELQCHLLKKPSWLGSFFSYLPSRSRHAVLDMQLHLTKHLRHNDIKPSKHTNTKHSVMLCHLCCFRAWFVRVTLYMMEYVVDTVWWYKENSWYQRLRPSLSRISSPPCIEWHPGSSSIRPHARVRESEHPLLEVMCPDEEKYLSL